MTSDLIITLPSYFAAIGGVSFVRIETRKIGNTWEARERRDDNDAAWHHGKTRKGVVRSVALASGVPEYML